MKIAINRCYGGLLSVLKSWVMMQAVRVQNSK